MGGKERERRAKSFASRPAAFVRLFVGWLVLRTVRSPRRDRVSASPARPSVRTAFFPTLFAHSSNKSGGSRRSVLINFGRQKLGNAGLCDILEKSALPRFRPNVFRRFVSSIESAPYRVEYAHVAAQRTRIRTCTSVHHYSFRLIGKLHSLLSTLPALPSKQLLLFERSPSIAFPNNDHGERTY